MNVGRYLRGEDRHVGTARTTKSKDVKVGKANAYLIAAAPELLEFVEEVRRTGDTRLASMAIVVIAKAKGEA